VAVHFPDGSERAVWWPHQSGAQSLKDQVPVNYHEHQVGEIGVQKVPGSAMSPGELKLLRGLAAQAGLVLHNIRLTAELQTRLNELTAQAESIRASRQRLMTAATRERERLEETIRGGVEAELAALAERLAGVEPLLDTDAEQASAALEKLTADVQRTLDALRQLAHGIYPPLLKDQGLVPALRSQIAKSAVPVAGRREFRRTIRGRNRGGCVFRLPGGPSGR